MNLSDQKSFSEELYCQMCQVNSGISKMALYEFRYCLNNIIPNEGWQSITLESVELISAQINDIGFYKGVQFKPIEKDKIILDENIRHLTQMLMTGLVIGTYSLEWVRKYFFFDIRAFVFFVKTNYYNQQIQNHFNNKPSFQFERQQKSLEGLQDIGYLEFSQANAKVDGAFMEIIGTIIQKYSTPIILALVGPTGAGKTEIIERLQTYLRSVGLLPSSIEMDNFYKDGAFREGKTLNKELIHFDHFVNAMHAIHSGKETLIPRYNFTTTTSSHDLQGQLRSGCEPLLIKPGDIIFIEGNYPFHEPDVAPLVGIKIVYLTSDEVRLKRKWRRDIDYRKKYDPVYFVNRYFRTQFIRAEEVYRPLMQASEIIVDTSDAAIWLTGDIQELITIKE